jgi:hypothetical protein
VTSVYGWSAARIDLTMSAARVESAWGATRRGAMCMCAVAVSSSNALISGPTVFALSSGMFWSIQNTCPSIGPRLGTAGVPCPSAEVPTVNARSSARIEVCGMAGLW